MPDDHDKPLAATRRVDAEPSRLDNFVDGAFAFAITLLVISGGNVPRDITALAHALRGVPAFAACFAQLALFWYGHVRWRDTVRVVDGTSLRLSLLLVFFALIFVFPLHLVYASLFHGLSAGVLSPDFSFAAADAAGLVGLFVCYGLSYACMAGTLALLFHHGLRVARLDHAETVTARVSARVWLYSASVGLVSAAIALTALWVPGGWTIGVAGFAYGSLALLGLFSSRWRRRFEAGG